MITDARGALTRIARGRTVQVLGVVISLASYYLLRAVGASVWVAAVLPSVVTILLALIRWVRYRKIDPLTLALLTIVVLGVALSLWSGNPRLMFAKGAIATFGVGCIFLASLWWHRPLAFSLTRPLVVGLGWRTRDWDDVWDSEPRFRRAWQTSTALWGIALITDGVLIVLLSYRLPIDAVSGMITLTRIATFVLLQILTNVELSRRGVWRVLQLHARRARSPQSAP